MRIDAHQHFWRPERGDYGWLTHDLAPLYRVFEPDDLAPELDRNDIGGTVLVQAAPTVAETAYMLSLADATEIVLGVVGWIDLEAMDAAAQIAHLAKHPKIVGLRPMIQDMIDMDWMLQATLTPAIKAMIEHDLAFDALTLPNHLPNLLELCGRHADLRVVIDHASKPDIKTGTFDAWAKDMAAMASQTSACVKLSGLVTEARADWETADFAPYVDHLLEHFGPNRMIWGSDWPVCTLACDYTRWVETTQTLLAALSEFERAAIMGGNAAQFYKLEGRGE
ncbi:MAG: amidohydrolase family protein [Rhodobacterales bacterium]|jgi:L-fuconolactonase